MTAVVFMELRYYEDTRIVKFGHLPPEIQLKLHLDLQMVSGYSFKKSNVETMRSSTQFAYLRQFTDLGTSRHI
jgi:hypothetical protein